MPPPKSLPGLPEDYTSKFFGGDVVTRLLDSSYRAKRCWADEEGDLPELPPGHERHPLDRPLLRGEVGISEMGNGALHIVPESSLVLYQREFMRGDIVKRSLTKVESALVVDSHSEVILQHVVTKQRIKKWVPYERLRNSLVVEARDRVVYDEWLGTIEEVLEEALVEGPGGKTYNMVEMGGFLDIGRTISVVPRHLLGTPGVPTTSTPDTDRILDVRPVLIAVTWHAINQKLSVNEQENHPEPKRIWDNEEMKALTHFDSTASRSPMVGYSVKFESESDASEYGAPSSSHLGGSKTLHVYEVVEARTKLTLRWQDGTETQDWAHELVPYDNIDDYEMWPGEHLVWRGDSGERRPAVLKRFDAHQRLADLTFTDNNETQTVSVLELDPGSQGKRYGAPFGSHVLLCDDNACPAPEIPILGRFGNPMDNMIWRNELAERADEVVRANKKSTDVRFEGDQKKVDWYGEVVQLYLDGTLGVLLVSGERKRVSLREVHLLGDPMEAEDMMGPTDEEAAWAEEMGMGIGMPMGMGMGMDFDIGVGSDASWETMSGKEDQRDWSDEEDGRNDDVMEIDDEEQERRDVEEVDPLVAPSSPGWTDSPKADDQPLPKPEREVEAGPSSPRRASIPNGTATVRGSFAEDESWQRFEMLEEAPEDHHFFGQLSNQAGSRAYHSRLAKEHRALASSLPENILVRTYENRTDLLRCLIIGPEGTPYANAPFVFDIYLDPTKFPHDPPAVHFHSHTFGKGRCNPNLYEDGKVCLSILGTWSGEKSESWNPAKSSLLQVFVSISGLVLVKSPYHCEPAFAKLEGTREGRINSRLYSEKAYVLSRSFVRTALDRPPTGLEKELKYLYLAQGRLDAVIEHARRLISKGEESAAANGAQGAEMEEENEEMWDGDAVGSLTMGAILTLKRTMIALEKLEQT